MVSDSLSLAQLRAELARAVMAVKRHPCDETRATVTRLRAAYAAAKLADYVARVVAASPPLTAEQRDTIMAAFAGFAPGGEAA